MGVGSDGWYWPLGVTALHWAASIGNVPLTALLVDEGANVNILDQGDNTPLKRAVHMGQMETAQWLLDNGANPDLAASNGQTPLHVATIRNWPEMVALLVKFGADNQLVDSQNRMPVDWAVAKGLSSLAQTLGAETDDVTIVDKRPFNTQTIWETGIKILDLVAPLKWGGRNGLFTPISGIGADVMLGELIHCMATRYGGKTVQIGFRKGDFTAESRQNQWRNFGVNNHITLFYGDEHDSDGKKLHLVQQAVKRVRELATNQPVLLIVYTYSPLSEQMIDAIATLDSIPNVTLLFDGHDTIGAEPLHYQNLDAAFTFDRLRGGLGWWPAIDMVRSYSHQCENSEHEALAKTAACLATRYQDLHLIYQNQGMAGFDMALYGDAERQAVVRGRRLHQFLRQPLTIAESWSSTLGQFVPLDETLKTVKAILDGEFDDVPEDELAKLGDWSPRWT